MNKMDATLPIPWSSDRFFAIEQNMRDFLCGDLHFDEHLVRCIPISGLTGQNLTSLDETCALAQWYEGPTLLEAMDGFLLPASRSLPLSFRAIIHDVLSIDKNRGRYEVAITVLQGAVSTRRTIACYACTSDIASTDGPQTMVVNGITTKDHFSRGGSSGQDSMLTRLRAGEQGLLQLSSQ